MNRTKLKNYAPQARRDFIGAMTDRAAFYGLTPAKAEPVVERGDVAVIAGREHPRAVAQKRRLLEDRVRRHGFGPTMEALAYTWFNRLVAVRFMELHGYLGHGYRVLSHPEGKPTPEIVEHAEHAELPGLKLDAIIDLKLAGNKEGALYRLLLLAQCNALHAAMPFLFERIDDETELLLPDNLLHSDSLIRKLVNEIEEADWQEVEVIGWLYQFYISEKKAEVIGKVVASEDIPAATQLFTPNWIVKYLVQNTLGRQWLAIYPQSALRPQMAYYIEPAEQAPEVQAQLKAITPPSLNPEDLTLLDPACGSGHILVEGYDLFKAIYTERGYNKREIPRLILEKNLFGLEIDDRAAQLAAFALMMKARADDRRIFESGVRPNVVALQNSGGVSAAEVTNALNSPLSRDDAPAEYLFEEIEQERDGMFSKKALAEPGHVSPSDIAALVALFENAKTFGSLIQVPPKLAAKLPEIEKRLGEVLAHGDLTHRPADALMPLLRQAGLLARQYDAVVANPPYMGSKYYTPTLKTFVNKHYNEAKADLYACFMERNRAASKPNGFQGMINIPNWMFLSGFEDMRKTLFETATIDTFAHNGRGVFGSDFGSCAFVIRKTHLPEYRGSFRRLFDKQGSVASNNELEARFHTATTHTPSNADFAKIPGSPVAYWVSESLRMAYSKFSTPGNLARKGLSTGNNDRYIRKWWEIDRTRTSTAGGTTWFPVTKGGEFRRWYGNLLDVLQFEHDGRLMQNDFDAGLTPGYRMMARDIFFVPGVTWSDISVAAFSARLVPPGCIPMDTGPVVSVSNPLPLLAALNSPPAWELLRISSPGVHFSVGHIAQVPIANGIASLSAAEFLVGLSRADWDSHETSWDFATLPILQHKLATLQASQEAADAECNARFARMKQLEEENNRLFIDAYGLQGELSPEVPDEQITLYRPNRAEDAKRLLSYAVGCMMGRYSLDKPGLVYAHAGNEGFDPGQYTTFPADPDGILPLTEHDWGFADDPAKRFGEFLSAVWPPESLAENLAFVAGGLLPKKGELPTDTVRRYFATEFTKHHLRSNSSSRKGKKKAQAGADSDEALAQESADAAPPVVASRLRAMYQNRPIYWLFTSGKLRAFQCLVYLHRYHEGTLARMRTEYVIPLQGRIGARIDRLDGDKAKAASTSHRKTLQKEQDDLKKQEAELRTFEEKLRHAADQRITLDLDDGVRVNYGKFGDLLAESKAICGAKEED